jgi:hypothetical protein
MIKNFYIKIFYIAILVISSMTSAYSFDCKDDITPELISKKPDIDNGFHASNTVQIEINKKSSEVQAWFDNVAPETIIHSTEGVSGIAATKSISDSKWGAKNSQRLVCYEDDSSSLEALLINEPGKLFKYQLWDFTNDFTHAIKYAISEFRVIPVNEDKSILEWKFSFRPNNYLFRLPLTVYINNSFKEYMEQGMKNIKVMLES